MTTPSAHTTRKLRPAHIVVWLITGILTSALIALGVWQIQRLGEKKVLLAAIEERAFGDAVPLPLNWETIGPKDQWEYKRVSVSGIFAHDKEVQVYTVTDIGPGYWVFTPLLLNDAKSVLINRGFVPGDKRSPETRPEGQVQGQVNITGLMRATETGGLFLRANDLENQRYYRRDVAEIAKAKGLQQAAPFYVDADASPNPGGYPIGGKTQLKFPNSHMSYAITWFILAIMMLVAGWYISRNLNSAEKNQDEF